MGGWKSWEETDGEAEREERQTDRQRGRKTGREDVKQVADGERGRGGGEKKRGVVSPCVQAGAAH